MSFGLTRLETTPYRERLEELQKLLARQGSLGLLMIDVSPLTQVERDYGPGAFQSALGAANHTILELCGNEVRASDILTVSDRGGDALLVFLSASRRGTGPRIRELRAAAERVEEQINRRLAGLASRCPLSCLEVIVGFGLVLANPLVTPERLLARLVEDARDCIRVRDLQREFQNRCRIQEILMEDQLATVFQPVVELTRSTVLGYEALSRGPEGTSYQSPLSLFERAAESDMVFELDRVCRNHALLAARALPADAKLFVNVIPSSLYDPDFQEQALLRLLGELGLTPDRVVLEITEKYAIDNYPLFVEALEKLTRLGLSVAVDDIGAGYSGFEKIARLNPRYLKFDIELVRDIDASYVRREMARALKTFADRMGSTIIAEGIEREDERRTLIDLGIDYGQGFLLGRPASTFEAPAFAQARMEERPVPAASRVC